MSCGPTTTTSSTTPPAQFLQAYQNVVNRAGQVADQPLQQMPQPVAGFNPTQTNAFNNVNNAQGLATPFINSASDLVGAGTAPIADQVPLLSNDASASLASSGANTFTNPSQNYFMSALAALPMLLAMTGGGQQPTLGSPYSVPPGTQQYDLGSGTTQTPNIGPVSTAIGAIPDSTRGLVPDVNASTIGSFMSPYQQQVIDATQAQFNNQNAQQREALKGNAISQGAWGGDRAGIAAAELANQQGLAQNPVIAGLYNQGYSQALAAAQNQQQAGLQKAGLGIQQENYGLGSGQLSLSQQQAQTDAMLRQRQLEAGLGLQQEQTTGQLGLGQQQFDLSRYLGVGNLGLGQQGQALQGLGLGINAMQGQDASDLARAQAASGMYGQNVNAALAAAQGTGALNLQGAQQLGQLGLSGQDAALQAANAQLQTGSLQQQLEQQYLNVPYNMFQQAQQYPFYTSNFLAAITGNLGSLAGGSSRQTQPAPSALSQIAGVGMAAAPFLVADGGRIERDVGGGVMPMTYGAGPPAPPTATANGEMDPLKMLIASAPYLADLYKDGSFGALHKLFDKKTPGLGGAADYAYDFARAARGGGMEADGGRIDESTVLRAPQTHGLAAPPVMPHLSSPSQAIPVTSGTPGSLPAGQITTVPNRFAPVGTTLQNGTTGPLVPDWPAGFEPGAFAATTPGVADAEVNHHGFTPPVTPAYNLLLQQPSETEKAYKKRIKGVTYPGYTNVNGALVPTSESTPPASGFRKSLARGGFGGDFYVPGLPDLPGYLPFDVNDELSAHRGSMPPPPEIQNAQGGLGQAPSIAAPGTGTADPGDETSIFGKGKNQDWRMALLTAGLGTLAGTSPNAGANIGRGGLMGLQALAQGRGEKEAKRKELKQEGFEERRIGIAKESADNAAARLLAETDHWKAEEARQVKEADSLAQYRQGETAGRTADREQRHQESAADRADKTADRELRRSENESEAAYRNRMAGVAEQNADAGRWTYVGQDEEGKGIFVDSKTGEEKVSSSKIKPKGNASGKSVSEWKHDAWLLAHPGDEQGALDYAGGHRTLGDTEIMKGAFSQARAEASANPGSLPDATAINARAAEIAKLIKGAGGKEAPDALPAPARAALKEGIATTFGNGQVWTLKGGQPSRVK